MLTAKRNRLNADIASASIFLRATKEVIRKYSKSIFLFPRGHKKVFLHGVVEDNDKEVDVRQDIVSVTF